MVPNLEEQMQNLLQNPVRDAAIHFGTFLQLKGLLHGGDETYGNIELNELFNQFTNHYQPLYRTYLVLPDLLPTLRRNRVILRNHRKGQQSNVVRVAKHPHPDQVRPPSGEPRQRLYIDQARVLRDRMVRSDVVNEAYCRLCQVSFSQRENKQEHVDSDIHKFRLQYREKRSSFKNKVGEVSIAVVDLDNKNEVILRTNEQRSVTVKVSINVPYSTADVHKIFNLEQIEARPTQFHKDAPIEVHVTAMFSDPGAYIYPLVAKIMPAKICLLKDLIFRVESELMDKLAPVSPYTHHEDVIREMEGAIIPGEQLPHAEFNLQIKVKLGEHKILPVYNKLLMHKFEEYDNMPLREQDALQEVLHLLCGHISYKDALSQVSKTKAPFINPLDHKNYADRFTVLVDFEELQQQRQVKNYDRSRQKVQKCNTKFLLQVPDLSEGRPSVNKGDKVHVRLENDDTVIYEGVIHECREQGLLLGFHREFINQYVRLKSSGVEPRIDVRFIVNRFPYLNMHRALSLMSKHHAQEIVFPVRPQIRRRSVPAPTLRSWGNSLIGTNPEQQKAVKKIISRDSGTAPYLIFGPPGTGKTVTLVETITQVWHITQTQAVKQLVCAPSNAACNNIAERLITTLPNSAKIIRLLSLSTEIMNVPEILHHHSNYNKKSKSIYMPTIEQIMAHHIIVVTIVSAGRLVTGGAGGQFHFVYIDECGQASEPEALIAIAGILTTKHHVNVGQLVLAGDPEQLGPILSSTPAKDFGLGMSLLERLMKHNALYRRVEGSGYDDNYLTKLVQNFRSHPAILSIPNKLFYDNELQVKGNPNIINKAIGWPVLPNPDFPLIFHGVQGLDERESNSPSYFNRHEIDVVISYLKKLLFETGLPNYKVKQEDIGIITPYRKQVQKFRKAFELLQWDIRVGSVEEFQGSEKLIIFISTVRSNIALVEEDYRFSLGFLKNPKRFNVSVTRAQALLVVVGNPNILRHDKHWNQLLNYCRDNHAAVGIPFPDDDPSEHQQEHIAS